MLYQNDYHSPLGKITLVSNEKYLLGVYIEGQKYFLRQYEQQKIIFSEEIQILKNAKKWLDSYFCYENPSIDSLNLFFEGTTFEVCIWKLLCEIPFGQTITYGELAHKVAKNLNKNKMSAQAVGQAVSHNPFSIIVPCHRVIGKNGNLTGYAGGIDKKIQLLTFEHVNLEKMYIKEKGKKKLWKEIVANGSI